jgi:hypothetical protein
MINMRSHKVILGHSPWLDVAIEDWQQVNPDLQIHRVEIVLDRHYAYAIPQLAELDPTITTAFVAWGPEFLNFQRLELMNELKKRGYKMPPLLHPRALISSSATFQENSWVQALAVIGPCVKIGLNVHVGFSTRVGAHGLLGKHAWIGQDVRIGTGARVESYAVIGDNVVVGDGIRIGRQAVIETAGLISIDWPDRAFRLRHSGLEGEIIEL